MSFKNILIKTLAILLIASACEQEEFTGTGLESLREFTLTPVPGARINLSSVDRQGELVISWSQARSGFDSPVTYTWMLDEPNGDFSDPLISSLSDNDGSATTITFTNEQLDDFLEGRGLDIGEELEAVWTVSATNGDIIQVADSAVITLRRYVNAIAPFSPITPENQSTVNLDIDNPTAEIIIDWDSTFIGFGGEVSYTWLADEEGGEFTDPLLEYVSDNGGIDHQLTVTNQALEDALATLGVAEGQATTIDWKVIATGAGLEMSSSIFTVTIKRFFTPPTAIFLVGGSTSAGWNPPTSIPFVQTGEGMFEIYAYIEVDGDGFKILESQDGYDGDWGAGSDAGQLVQEGEVNFEVSENGFYRLSVNYNDLTYSLDRFQWAIIGSATPNGWDESADTDMTFNGEKGDYSWTVTTNLTDGDMKFRANDSWEVNFGDDGNDGSLEINGANIPVSSGNDVTITLTLDPVNGYAYSITM